MKNYYRIISIEHSGRKDIRGMPVTDDRYYGLVGAVVDIGNLREMAMAADAEHMWHYARLYIKSGPRVGEIWTTSKVIGLVIGHDSIEIETANTIYRLEKIDD